MLRISLAITAAIGLSACTGIGGEADVNDKTKFSTSSYGAASPRVTRSRKVRPGGGKRHVGKPYKIRGKWYRPKLEPGYDRVGSASWYGPNFHGRKTANGEIYNQYGFSAAHPTMPLPSYARVTNLKNGESTIVRVNDRGPFHGERMIDLSGGAAKRLDYRHTGIARVRVQYIGPAPLHGKDARYLKRSHKTYDVAKLKASAARAVASRRARSNLSSRFILSMASRPVTSAGETAITDRLAKD